MKILYARVFIPDGSMTSSSAKKMRLKMKRTWARKTPRRSRSRFGIARGMAAHRSPRTVKEAIRAGSTRGGANRLSGSRGIDFAERRAALKLDITIDGRKRRVELNRTGSRVEGLIDG